MNVETFLDYNQILKVSFEILDDDINYKFTCKVDEKELDERILENLNKISKIKRVEGTNIYRLTINETIFIDIDKSTGQINNINKLTAFETRMLAQSKLSVVPFERKEEKFIPKTDLHTHFAGAMTPDTLIMIGKKHDIDYPMKYLTRIGVDTNKYETDEFGNIKLNSLNDEDINLLKKSLQMSLITQETFNEMEEVYELRDPFVKNKELFPEFLEALAIEYKNNGVEYAELSLASFFKSYEYLEMLEKYLPQIEKETGVKIRFLAGLGRHSKREQLEDRADMLKQIAKSPYIVGCDFMGQETNSTDTFIKELQELAKYAMEEDPDFIIRVHAGENPMFKENVKRALEIVYKAHQDLEEKTEQTQPMPRIRIGHGLYGVDEEVLKMAQEMGAIIEFNMSSNLALNNINNITEIPIKKYLDKGVKVLLGTDGHGLYSTSGEQEVILASAIGLEIKDFERISEIEEEIIAIAKEREKKHPIVENVKHLYEEIKYSTPDGKVRYTKEVEHQYKEEEKKASKKLAEKIAYIGAITDEKNIEKDTIGKTPILITGASKGNWPNILPEDQKHIELAMQVLSNVLNPETTYIVTGGTNFGVEKTMHEAVHRRNLREKNPLVLLGTLTMEATKEECNGVKENTITHATILDLNGKKADSWMDLPDTQLIYTYERNGHMIAVGGGEVVKNMIQRAHNLGVNMHLMDGPYGASTSKSKSLAGNDYSFKTIEQLILRLYGKNSEMFLEEFSLEKIDEYIKQAQLEITGESITENPANFGLGAIEKIDEEVTAEERVKCTERLKGEIKNSKKEVSNKKEEIK